MKRLQLIVLMILGSVGIWFGSPLFWLWLTSKLQSGTQATMGPYGVMLVGFIATSVLLGKGLATLNRRYADLRKDDGLVRIHLPWLRMRGGEHEVRAIPVTVLDVIMTLTVMGVAIAFVVWFAVVQPTPPHVPAGPSKD